MMMYCVCTVQFVRMNYLSGLHCDLLGLVGIFKFIDICMIHS